MSDTKKYQIVGSFVGPQGPQGPAGSDATVTAESIKNALGYTPANETDVSKLSEEINALPFWIEEKRTLVGEGIPDDIGPYPVELPLIKGKEYTIVVDGVKYVGECQEESGERFITAPKDDNNWVIKIDEDYAFLVSPPFDTGEYHKIEFVEEVYHTTHDFMVIINGQNGENDSSCDGKLVAGDFVAAKEKVLNGLPVTAYVCSTFFNGWENYQEKLNYVSDTAYSISVDGTEEWFYGCGYYAFYIYPDGTVEIE